MNRELHKAGSRSCMHIEVDITGSKIKYDKLVSYIYMSEFMKTVLKTLHQNSGHVFGKLVRKCT